MSHIFEFVQPPKLCKIDRLSHIDSQIEPTVIGPRKCNNKLSLFLLDFA